MTSGHGGRAIEDEAVEGEAGADQEDRHVAAGDAARKFNAGQFSDAERLIGSGSRFALVSTEVSTLLTKAKRGL